MIRQSLKGKIIIPTVIIFVFLVLTLTAYASVKFSNYTGTLQNDRINVTANGLKSYLFTGERESKAAAVSMSANADVLQAVQERNTDRIITLLTPMLDLYNISYFMVADETGTVLARTHDLDHNNGDSALEQQHVKDALAGRVSTYYEACNLVRVAVRTGSPIYNDAGTLVGVLSAVVRLDTNEVVDNLKQQYDAEFTIFVGDTRLATTILKNGERIIGTLLDPEVAQTVLNNKQEYTGRADILGENYSTFYHPLHDPHGNILAVFFAGKSNTLLINERNKLITNAILIGLAGLTLSILSLLLIINRSLKPLNRLASIITDVTHGRISHISAGVDKNHISQDEVGKLILDVYTLIGTIQRLLSDLTQLTDSMSIYSTLEFRIDTGKYSGSYKEIISTIKTLVDSNTMMNKTMAVMDFLDTMITVIDLDYNLLYINRSMADTYGVDREKCIGEKCYQTIRGLDHPCAICQLPHLLPGKESFPSLNYEFEKDESTGSWLGGHAAIIRWVDGAMVFVNSSNDETVKMLQQEQLREAVSTAQTASAAKSAFLANMSHELRTPLNVIVGLTDLQLEEETLPEDMRDNLEKISAAGSTLLSIVNDVLDISKIESGKIMLTPVIYQLASLLNDTAILNMARIGEKPVALHLNIDDDLPHELYGDDLRVKQIINNLLSNAIKYTQQGTIELSLSWQRDGVDIWLDITVSDTGIGIRTEDMSNLFTDYHQADARANRQIEGTGLGLAITRKLAEIMDGDISATSEHGIGSAFHVRIKQGFVTDTPIGPTVAANLRGFRYNKTQSASAGRLVRMDLSQANVLIVDDLQSNLDVAAGLMLKYKMQVDCVTSGQAAIDRIRSAQPLYHAVFMDHMMPEMDGIETTALIRTLGTAYADTVPIIALTANAIAGTEKLFYEHGFQDYLTKPIDIMKLDAVIRRWVKPSLSSENDRSLEHDCSAHTASALQEIPGLHLETGLAVCGGNTELYQSILRTYASDTSARLPALRRVTEASLPDYRIAVHGIKGASANIGAHEVQAAAAELESMATEGDLAGIHERNESFLQRVSQLVAAIVAR